MDWLYSDETWDDLLRDQMGVIQPASGYRFTMDAVLLAHFAAQLPGNRVLDLGTGCGIIALLLASRLPDALITGVEIQPEQADRAQRSVFANRLEDRIKIIQGDLKSPDLLPGNFSLITMNPPFFPYGRGKLPTQKSIAISRHEIECTLKDVFGAVKRWLTPEGRFCLVLPPGRQQEADRTAREVNLSLSRCRNVHPRLGLPANLLLLEYDDQSIKAKQLPPLYVYREDGQYTADIMDIYFG